MTDNTLANITILDEEDELANAIVSDLPPQKPETIPELARINELALKSKTQTLSEDEILERDSLRKAYLHRFRGNVQSLMSSVTVQDEAGNDVTPAGLYYAKKAGIPDAVNSDTPDNL